MATHALRSELFRTTWLQQLPRRLAAAWARVRARLAAHRPARLERLEIPALEAWSTLVGGGGVVVRCETGAIWITREGDPEDRVLTGPASFASARRGRLGVTAFTATRLVVERDPVARL